MRLVFAPSESAPVDLAPQADNLANDQQEKKKEIDTHFICNTTLRRERYCLERSKRIKFDRRVSEGRTNQLRFYSITDTFLYILSRLDR